MGYYVIEFTAVIDGSQMEREKMGSLSGDKDYHPK
jgi:hypothetical protein